MGIFRHGRKVLLILLVFLLLGWEGRGESSLASTVEAGQETTDCNDNETDSWDPEEDETDRVVSSEEEQETDADRQEVWEKAENQWEEFGKKEKYESNQWKKIND